MFYQKFPLFSILCAPFLSPLTGNANFMSNTCYPFDIRDIFPEKFRLQWITLFYCEFIKTFIDKLVRQDLKEEKPFIADEVESFACNAGGNLVDIKMTCEI